MSDAMTAAEKVAREIADLIEGSEQYAVGGDVRALVPDIAARLGPLMEAVERVANNASPRKYEGRRWYTVVSRDMEFLRSTYAALLEPKP